MPDEYAELHCHSAFSLLDGASTPEDLVVRAHRLGLHALALTDHDELGGTVRFAQMAGELGVRGIIGAEITVSALSSPRARCTPDSPRPSDSHLVLLAESTEGYGNLSTLITRARMDAPRGHPSVSLELIAQHSRGLFCLTGCPRGLVPTFVADGDTDAACEAAASLLDIFEGRLAIECWDHALPEERTVVPQLIRIAQSLGVPWVVTNDVHYAEPRGRTTHDVLACLRHQLTLDTMGTRLRPNGEWYLKSPAQMRRRWQHDDAGIRATVEVAERCAFRMEMLKPRLPTFPLPPGVTADEYLERLVWQGARERWGDKLSEKQRKQLRHELDMIKKLDLAGYFLIVWDIVRFAHREGVLCQGRGSAANSAVCYCLAITAVDPVKLELLFERFLSENRTEAPDIDIDFAHRDREKVIQYVYERYGREHAAMVCEQISYRGRSAVRDAARVLGFSVDQANALSTLSDRFSAKATAEVLKAEPDENATVSVGRHKDATKEKLTSADRPMPNAAYEPYGSPNARDLPAGVGDPYARDDHVERRNPVTALRGTEDAITVLERAGLDPADVRVKALSGIVAGLHQLPRHRSIHVGGFVLTREPLRTVVPIEPASMPGRTVIQWEKDDLDPVGLVKIDLLGLGMLTVLQDCIRYIRAARGVTIDLGQLDMTDQAVYDDLCAADTVGVFQVESRAQMNTLPRLKPRCFYDLVVEVAIIRPGPIQGDMVHPYLRRRAGEEPVTYLHPSLEPILKRTLGVPLFQEQGMQVAITAAGFTPGEADQLRRAMGHKRSHERMAAICERMIEGMSRNGIPEEDARRIYNQINGFADYGFPESHAASFALIVYASAYLRHYYPAEFLAAMLNAQPMGFYSPSTLIEDARRHGVSVRPVDLMCSAWDHTLELRDGRTVVPHDGHVRVIRSVSSQPVESEAPVVRLGLRSIRGLGARARAKLEAGLAGGPFTDIADVVRRSGLDQRGLRLLAESGAFDSMIPGLSRDRKRRTALWAVLDARRGDAGPLAPRGDSADAMASRLPTMSPLEMTEADFRVTGLSLFGHPMRHLRKTLAPNGILTAREIAQCRDGQKVATAGLVICRQRPGTAKGFVFLTLEDETGMINVVVTPKRFERQALMISTAPLLLVRGTLQIESGVVNLRGEQFRALETAVGAEHAEGHDFH
jgi:error-prone DNA polymerase